MSEVTILLDCDDVITDFIGTLVNEYNNIHGAEHKTEEIITSWNSPNEMSPPLWSVFDCKPDVISTMPLKDKKIPKILRKIKKRGAIIKVVTATKSIKEINDKKELLAKLGVMEYIDEFIATPCKHVVDGDVLVDDHFDNLNEYKKHHPNAYTLLMETHSNRNKDNQGHVRIPNWQCLEYALNEIIDYYDNLEKENS